MSNLDTATVAIVLLGAYEQRTLIKPFTTIFPGLTVRNFYLIQLQQVQCWVMGGPRVVGHKVGLASITMQRILKINTPNR